ncbi:methyltransferase [Truncatella angustata]|uniref:Methyltransferase n=1 Tax=Truncatella angustata TaxID=152316 RepID=A0A9P8UYC8_9PEZI|nr:methyltransferase [Truncatella angustata]KAH6660628.1 methyltransferase [Truncatella angustata]
MSSQVQVNSDSAAHPGDQHEVPSYEAHGNFDTLKDRIKLHYNVASDYYYSLWGQHIHHGYWRSGDETKEEAQVNLIKYLLELSGLPRSTNVLDVGCGIGGTSRYLAKEQGCHVTGITISGKQVEIAKRLTLADSPVGEQLQSSDVLSFPPGSVRYLELDAEKMRDHFSTNGGKPEHGFDCVWISEALSHFPNKQLFFDNAFSLLGTSPSSRLVVADWFKAPNLTEEQDKADIKPIEDGMLLPPMCTVDEYVAMAKKAGFRLSAAEDISKDVAKTWDISWSLVSSPSLWAFAISWGRDGLNFLQAFRAMRRGYANGTFKYALIVFDKN